MSSQPKITKQILRDSFQNLLKIKRWAGKKVRSTMSRKTENGTLGILSNWCVRVNFSNRGLKIFELNHITRKILIRTAFLPEKKINK